MRGTVIAYEPGGSQPRMKIGSTCSACFSVPRRQSCRRSFYFRKRLRNRQFRNSVLCSRSRDFLPPEWMALAAYPASGVPVRPVQIEASPPRAPCPAEATGIEMSCTNFLFTSSLVSLLIGVPAFAQPVIEFTGAR